MSVEIVNDPDIQSGRATFKGTRMTVYTVVDAMRDPDCGREWMHENFPHVSDEQIDAAMAHRFDPIHAEPELWVEDSVLTCVCGETADEYDADDARLRVCGYCGRRWRVTVAAGLAS